MLHVEVIRKKTQNTNRENRFSAGLVETKGLGEDVGVLSIHRNIRKFNFTGEDKLADKVVVHLNVLISGVEDGVLRKLDAAEVVTVDRRRIRHLHLQILK